MGVAWPPTSPGPHGQPALRALQAPVRRRALVEALVGPRHVGDGHRGDGGGEAGAEGDDLLAVPEEGGLAVVRRRVAALQHHCGALGDGGDGGP